MDRKVHLLVLEAFVGPRPSPTHDACHGIGGPRDNSLANLRWGTKQENADDRLLHGTQVRGEQVGISQLSAEQVLEVKAAIPKWKRGMCTEFGNKFGVCHTTIADIRDGKTWAHL